MLADPKILGVLIFGCLAVFISGIEAGANYGFRLGPNPYPPRSEPEPKPCLLRPSVDKGHFEQYVDGKGWIVRKCADGSGFSEADCECSIHLELESKTKTDTDSDDCDEGDYGTGNNNDGKDSDVMSVAQRLFRVFLSFFVKHIYRADSSGLRSPLSAPKFGKKHVERVNNYGSGLLAEGSLRVNNAEDTVNQFRQFLVQGRHTSQLLRSAGNRRSSETSPGHGESGARKKGSGAGRAAHDDFHARQSGDGSYGGIEHPHHRAQAGSGGAYGGSLIRTGTYGGPTRSEYGARKSGGAPAYSLGKGSSGSVYGGPSGAERRRGEASSSGGSDRSSYGAPTRKVVRPESHGIQRSGPSYGGQVFSKSAHFAEGPHY